MAGSRKIKVIYRKLGRERVWGQADDFVEIDPRLKGKKHLEILIHESLHVLFPNASEDEIENKAIRLTNTLWDEKYRRVDDSQHLPMQDGKK